MRQSEPSFFLTKNTGAPMGDLDRCGHSQGSPGGSHQAPSVLQGTGGMSRSKGVQSQVRGQWWVPCLPWWEFVKGFLREDISAVMVLGQCRQDNGSVCEQPRYE